VATVIVMPALGMAQETGTLVRWLHQPGERVTRGEPLMTVETDKAVVEIEAPATGILGQPLIKEGETVPVGRAIGHILAPGEPAPSPPLPRQAGEGDGAAAAGDTLPPPGRMAGVGVLASPKARRLAAERGLDLASIAGSGPDGAVTAADLARVGPAPPAAAAAPTGGRIWRLMAERTTASWTTAPHFFLTREVDAGRLVAWRRALARRELEVTYSDLLVHLTAACLRRHPLMNATWRDGRPLPREEVNVCLAVAVDDGLVAPVIAAADRLSLAEISSVRRRLTERARAGRLAPADLDGGTFTISNLGMYGVDAFSAILNGSQAGILAVGRIVDQVVPVEGRPEVRPRMALVLSCDHRQIDGARAARFLGELAELIEEPLGLVG
jgi:pyruvate dehydrogenase E2 component (dihydrolipoamide acetyltransferase)